MDTRLSFLQIGNELTAIHHLIESHAVILRQQILHRYKKTQLRESILDTPQTYGLKPTYVKFETESSDNTLKSKLSEMPKGFIYTFCFFILCNMYLS